MKFQPDRAEGVNVVTRREPGRLWVGGALHLGSVLVPWRGDVRAWNVDPATSPRPDWFEQVLVLRPELVIFGSGTALRFPPASAWRCLIEAGIGMETMDTAAACRTYNVLAAEGREVVGALIA